MDMKAIVMTALGTITGMFAVMKGRDYYESRNAKYDVEKQIFGKKQDTEAEVRYREDERKYRMRLDENRKIRSAVESEVMSEVSSMPIDDVDTELRNSGMGSVGMMTDRVKRENLRDIRTEKIMAGKKLPSLPMPKPKDYGISEGRAKKILGDLNG